MLINMGQMVEDVFRKFESEHEGCSVKWFAEQLHCDRRNVYDIFKRYTIDTQLLTQICLVLEYNFFSDLAEKVKAQMSNNPANKLTSFKTQSKQLQYFWNDDDSEVQTFCYSDLLSDACRVEMMLVKKMLGFQV